MNNLLRIPITYHSSTCSNFGTQRSFATPPFQNSVRALDCQILETLITKIHELIRLRPYLLYTV